MTCELICEGPVRVFPITFSICTHRHSDNIDCNTSCCTNIHCSVIFSSFDV